MFSTSRRWASRPDDQQNVPLNGYLDIDRSSWRSAGSLLTNWNPEVIHAIEWASHGGSGWGFDVVVDGVTVGLVRQAGGLGDSYIYGDDGFNYLVDDWYTTTNTPITPTFLPGYSTYALGDALRGWQRLHRSRGRTRPD